MATEVDFTDDEIREELANLGYSNVPQEKLEDFKRDLMKLITSERSKSGSLDCSNLTEENSGLAEASPISLLNGYDYAKGNFSNHGSHLNEKGFKEDWHYKGEHHQTSRPQTAPSRQSRPVYGKYDYLDQPFTSGMTERDQSCLNNSALGPKCIKRKTSRKTSDGNRMVDESFTTDTDSETAGIYEIYEKIKNLAMRECECGKSGQRSGDIEPPYRFKGKVNKNPSVMKCNKEPPHTRNLVRTDRNARLQMYEKCWKSQPAIGEDHRQSLRKAVRSKLREQFDIQLPQKVYVPNLYVPPHQKDRLNLRWSVRKTLQCYEVPKPGFYHEV